MNDITILYCGAFKPLSGAHIYLIDKYLQYSNVNKVVLFISPSKRGDIDCDIAYYIAKNILKNKNVEIVLDKNSYSPILSVYRWIENKDRKPGFYALASSNKDDDYKRVKDFSNNYSKEIYKNNLPIGVEITECVLDVEPLTYLEGRDKDKPICSSRIREDLQNNDFESFKDNYPFSELKDIKFIWRVLNRVT